MILRTWTALRTSRQGTREEIDDTSVGRGDIYDSGHRTGTRRGLKRRSHQTRAEFKVWEWTTSPPRTWESWWCKPIRWRSPPGARSGSFEPGALDESRWGPERWTSVDDHDNWLGSCDDARSNPRWDNRQVRTSLIDNQETIERRSYVLCNKSPLFRKLSNYDWSIVIAINFHWSRRKSPLFYEKSYILSYINFCWTVAKIMHQFCLKLRF